MDCAICGRKATGKHYGVVTCPGCKAFFRRTVKDSLKYACTSRERCATRSRAVCCRACRYEKCLQLGMEMRNCNNMKKKKVSTAEIQSASSQNRSPEYSLQKVSQERLNSPETEPERWASPSETVVVESSKNPSEPDEQIRLAPFLYRHAEILDMNVRQRWRTLHAVEQAVDQVYGQELAQWRIFMNRVLNGGEVPKQHDVTLERMLKAVNQHNISNITNNRRFARLLPGMSELDGNVKRAILGDWKSLVCAMIHHAPCFANHDFYLTVGEDMLVYNRFWQEQLIEPQLTDFVFRFCDIINDIGLTQTEAYILLAVVLFEPSIEVADLGPAKNHYFLELMHRHYTDVLFAVLKRRCLDSRQLNSICAKLNLFFGALNEAAKVHEKCRRNLKTENYPMQYPAIATVFKALEHEVNDCTW